MTLNDSLHTRCSHSQMSNIHTRLASSQDDNHAITGSLELLTRLELRRVHRARHLIHARDIGDRRIDVKATTDGDSIEEVLCALSILLEGQDVASCLVATDFENLSRALYVRPELELGAVVLEVLAVLLRRHEVVCVGAEAEVGEGSQELGRDQLRRESVHAEE